MADEGGFGLLRPKVWHLGDLLSVGGIGAHFLSVMK
jgi:hypothetical protein